MPALTPLLDFGPKLVSVCTYQAISGAGKTFERWPEILDNVVPYIGGEERWKDYKTIAQELALPSAPSPFIRYMEEPDRPQTRLDRDFERGMGICIGRLREDPIFDYKFVCLSHNTLRGAAGGGVLSAELLCAQGYIQRKE